MWRVIGAVLLLAAPALAEERSEFDIFVSGLKAGRLILVGTEQGGRYSVRGVGQSAGLVRGLVTFTVEAQAAGRVTGNRYRPSTYSEVVKGREGTERQSFQYGSALSITRNTPETGRKSYHVGPKGQARALDPLTAVWAFLRDRPEALACDIAYQGYNGRQVSSLRLTGGRRDGEVLTCPGVYTRVAGYSAKELAKQTRWPFTLTYRAVAGVMRVESMRLQSTFGPMVFRRR